MIFRRFKHWIIHFILVSVILFLAAKKHYTFNRVSHQERIWHGGNPSQSRPGSCWCSHDEYCMCTPSLAIDLIISSGPNHVLLVKRKDTNQLATMGGFVNVGESTEEAVQRELLEETGLKLNGFRLFGIYSDPRRDSRRHTASVVYVVDAPINAKTSAADDVKDVVRVALDDIGTRVQNLFADHMTIMMDYKISLKTEQSVKDTQDIHRSTCLDSGLNLEKGMVYHE